MGKDIFARDEWVDPPVRLWSSIDTFFVTDRFLWSRRSTRITKKLVTRVNDMGGLYNDVMQCFVISPNMTAFRV